MTRRNLVWILAVFLLALLFWRMPDTVSRHRSFYRVFSPLADIRAQIRKNYVEEVDDDELMEGAIQGMLQRLGIAQALVHDPKVVFLDEPMSGLDPYWRYKVQGILHDYKVEGGTILFSSHILVDVEKLADQIALIDNEICVVIILPGAWDRGRLGGRLPPC